MRKTLSALLALLSTFFSAAQENEIKYDSLMAKRLGGDQYGMKKYVLALLKTGPGDTVKGKIREELFAGHMRNIGDLAEQGKLSLAGPFSKNDLKWRGIFILNVDNIEEARKLCETDPTIRAGVFELELMQWYGSAGLQELNSIHQMITKPAEKKTTQK